MTSWGKIIVIPFYLQSKCCCWVKWHAWDLYKVEVGIEITVWPSESQTETLRDSQFQSPTERLEAEHHYCECKTRLGLGSREPCLWARLTHLWNSVSKSVKWACHGTLLWASNKIVDIESLLGSTHLRDWSITRRGCFFFSVLFCRLGGWLVSGHSELGGHYLWASAARHTISHNEHVTAFLHLSRMLQHSAFFKAKACIDSHLTFKQILTAGGSGDYFRVLLSMGER